MAATRSAIISTFIILCLFSLTLITLHLHFASKVCDEGTFLCNKSDICIQNRYRCDNYPHCPHGEDEDRLECADLYGGLQYYGNAISIINRTAFDNKLPCALHGYPAECNCVGINGTSLLCNEVGLTEVPRNISSNLKKLSMINNTVVLSNDSFAGYHSLKTIHLQYNQLLRIPPFIFEHQNRLKWLLLLNNNLSILEEDAFYGLNNLVNLFLDYNYLKYLNLKSWKHMNRLTWLDLSHNLLTFKNESFPYLRKLNLLNMGCNRIEAINEFLFADLPNIRDLDLSNNLIEVIDENAFKNTINLVELNLTNNKITTITQEILHPLQLLNKLALGFNPITKISGDIFSGMNNLSSLDMNGIDKKNMDMSLFSHLTQLQFLYLKEFHYCVLYVKHVEICRPNTDAISSSLHLLPDSISRWFLWMVTFFTLIMNALVLYGRMFSSLGDENKAISFVIRNLAVADMFMVVYLTVIGYHDVMYDDEYHRHAHEWQSSNLCTVIGIAAVISSEVSMLILVFLSLERFLLIAVPLSGYQVLKLKTAVYCMVSIWLVGISISIAPLLLCKHSSIFYGSNGLCYPLYIEDPFAIGWQYSAFMFLILHTSSLLLMSVLYALMFMSVRKTRREARISNGDFDFAVRFFFIVLANCLCWLPIIVLKFAALGKLHISSKTYVWLIIFVVPINALANPLIYTFTTPKYRIAITTKNIFTIPRSIRGTQDLIELSLSSYPGILTNRMVLKKKAKMVESKPKGKNSQESSVETTNGE